jgi:hypothetical protein
MTEPTPPEPGLSDDGDLLAAMRGVWDQVDPVPSHVLEAARGAFGWRDIDTELAELVLDSRLTDAGVRSAEGPRLLTFEAPGLTIEVEVGVTATGRNLVGQLVPPGPAMVTVRCNGPDRTIEADGLGRFSAVGVPAGPVSLLCHRVDAGGSTDLATSWVTI